MLFPKGLLYRVIKKKKKKKKKKKFGMDDN